MPGLIPLFVTPDAYDAGMTAAFDAERGTGQFTDALSGSDGTGDPSVLMPVLDVYPDALSAPMPIDNVPVIIPPTPVPPAPAGVRAAPVTGPASSSRAPAAARGQRQTRPAAGRVVDQQGRPLRPAPARPVGPTSAYPPARQSAQRAPATAQGRTMSASDLTAMFRTMRPGQSAQLDRTSFQATYPQSSGSGTPVATAPAAPMASQYSQRGQLRNTARNEASERRRSSSTRPGNTGPKRTSSTWAVIVFLFVIAFSTGLGQRVIEFFNELLNR